MDNNTIGHVQAAIKSALEPILAELAALRQEIEKLKEKSNG